MSGLEGASRSTLFVERKRQKLLKFYLKKYPKLFHICFDPIGTHRRARAIAGFILGFSLGTLFYLTIILDLHFDPLTGFIFGVMITFFLAVGCAASIQMRCICFLTIPSFFGKSGRGALKALVLGYIIAGPIFNLTFNGKEVVRTFACSTQLQYNLTKTKLDLMFKPFQQAIFNMKSDTEEIKDTLSSIRDVMSPIIEEIEGEEEMSRMNEENDYMDERLGDTKRSEEYKQKAKKEKQVAKSEGEVYEVKYREKITARCNEQLSRGTGRCNEMFQGIYDKCYNTVTIFAAWLLCWPMKLTFLCNLVQALGSSKICNPDGKVDVGIGEGYVKLKNAREEFGSNMKDAVLKYKVKIPPPIIDIRGPDDTAKAIIHEFEVRKKFFENVMTVLKRCLAFVFLKIIINAQRYHDKYLRDIEFDNIYITPYFRKIDARRRSRGASTLLPLKKVERMKFVDPFRLKQSKAERQNLIGQTVKLILEMVTATTFVLLDRLFFETLDLVRRHAYLEYTQTGHHDVKLEVKGTGVIAALIRSVIRGFNVKKHIKINVSNEACLPRPSELSNYILLKIYGTYILLWFMLYIQAYTQRIRRMIAAFFYRKREKRRILYVYNETTRQRLGFFRYQKRRIRSLVESQKFGHSMDPWLALRMRFPGPLGWLKFFACARPQCLICEETEPLKGPKYRHCTSPICNYVLCWDCWHDIGETCLACTNYPDSDSEDFDPEV